ncbi:MAG TPA: hypothetical protein VGV89_07200 [Thermoplasmata archaeon]|nr:hypothetical protein [Thermoplasmata archaeon]
MADGALWLAFAGLAGMMLAEVPQVLSGFLPSPSTAYDKASGGIETGPESMRVLERSKTKGTVVTLIMAGSVTAMAWPVVGVKALLLFAAALAILWLFLADFNDAIRRGRAYAAGGGSYEQA